MINSNSYDASNDPGFHADHARYLAAVHACQTGAMYWLEKEPKFGHFKYMRNEIDSALVETRTLYEFMLKAGLFTPAEYMKRLADNMELEKGRYESELSELFGAKITLT